jgi:hypothetical protein
MAILLRVTQVEKGGSGGKKWVYPVAGFLAA